jgi:hypothetical protein
MFNNCCFSISHFDGRGVFAAESSLVLLFLSIVLLMMAPSVSLGQDLPDLEPLSLDAPEVWGTAEERVVTRTVRNNGPGWVGSVYRYDQYYWSAYPDTVVDVGIDKNGGEHSTRR